MTLISGTVFGYSYYLPMMFIIKTFFMNHHFSITRNKNLSSNTKVSIVTGIILFFISITGLLIASTQEQINPLQGLAWLGLQLIIVLIAVLINEANKLKSKNAVIPQRIRQ